MLDENKFTFARSAVSLVKARLRSFEASKQALFSDLSNGYIRAIGYPGVLQNPVISTNLFAGKDLEFVPQGFWTSSTEDDRQDWDWSRGTFQIAKDRMLLVGIATRWDDVRIETDLLVEVGNKRSNRGRKRAATWEDWTAAIAVLASDGKLDPKMTETKLIEAVDYQLDTWGAQQVPRATVQAAVQKILERLREEQY